MLTIVLLYRKLIENYLGIVFSHFKKWKLFTLLNNVKSDLLHEEPHGVPLGFEPSTVYLLTINGLTCALNCKSNLHADDKVFIVAENIAERLEGKLNIEISETEIWLSNNKLSLTS